MATLTDIRSTRLSFFGRFTDDLSRDVLRPEEFRLGLGGGPIQPTPIAAYKPDGYFAFQNLKVSAATYELRFDSALYQRRSFLRALPTVDPVELTYGGEDEIYLSIKSVQVAAKRVVFDTIPFLPRILKGSQVRGQSGFATTLKENLEGVDVAAADLNLVTGLAAGQILRIIRSRALLAKPGPYYPFSQATTLLAFKVISSLPGGAPIEQAKAQIQKLNTVAPASVVVDGVDLRRVTLPSPPPGLALVLGPARDLATQSDARGQGVLYFPGQWPLATVELGVTATGYLPRTVTVAVVPKQRTFTTIELTPA